MSALLEVQGLWKKYSRDLKTSIRFATHDLLRPKAKKYPQSEKLRKTEFWALRDVEFSLRRGEVLGVLGHNGAGKSTLLKCIAGKLQHERGTIVRNGKMGHLLEMSAGFAPTMTGRDNVSVRGQLMGMRGKELQHYIAGVEEFADIGEFFDAPVQFYSSGMKSRLGFAASSVIEPDILIIDEVLAVGDLAFRLRCYERINELTRKSAVIFVSHSLGQVSRLCSRGMFLEKGRMLFEGDIQHAISLYNDSLDVSNSKRSVTTLNPERTNIQLLVNDLPHDAGNDVAYGAHLNLDIDISQLPKNAQIRVLLRSAAQDLLMDWNSARAELTWPDTSTTVRAGLGAAELSPGSYLISVQVMSPDGLDHVCISEPILFRVSGKLYYSNPIQCHAKWSFL